MGTENLLTFLTFIICLNFSQDPAGSLAMDRVARLAREARLAKLGRLPTLARLARLATLSPDWPDCQGCPITITKTNERICFFWPSAMRREYTKTRARADAVSVTRRECLSLPDREEAESLSSL